MAFIRVLLRLISYPYRKYIRYWTKMQFAEVGQQTVIAPLLRVQGGKNIRIGSSVGIHNSCWLAAEPLTGNEKASLVISDRTVLGDYNHIWATKSIIIEPSVLTANHVYISDNLHGYENINIPVIDQPIVQLKEVRIGEGSWLGENVCVIGASVGKHCVIGANAVVTKDIPDFCVAVGIPAKVVKRYDFQDKKWIRIC